MIPSKKNGGDVILSRDGKFLAEQCVAWHRRTRKRDAASHQSSATRLGSGLSERTAGNCESNSRFDIVAASATMACYQGAAVLSRTYFDKPSATIYVYFYAIFVVGDARGGKSVR
jgi:hypothetical protein